MEEEQNPAVTRSKEGVVADANKYARGGRRKQGLEGVAYSSRRGDMSTADLEFETQSFKSKSGRSVSSQIRVLINCIWQ